MCRKRCGTFLACVNTLSRSLLGQQNKKHHDSVSLLLLLFFVALESSWQHSCFRSLLPKWPAVRFLRPRTLVMKDKRQKTFIIVLCAPFTRAMELSSLLKSLLLLICVFFFSNPCYDRTSNSLAG
jgi:hypothetical protein